MTQQKICWRSI